MAAATAMRIMPQGAPRGSPSVDLEAARQYVVAISSPSTPVAEQIVALGRLCDMLEAEEAYFRELAGDPDWSPNQRSTHGIGKLLALLKDNEDVCGRLSDDWLLSRGATLEQQVAALRFVLAVLSCWGFQYPLTEDGLTDTLLAWAAERGDATPVPGDAPPTSQEEMLKEARSVYATGLLAIALSNDDVSDQYVRSPLVSGLAAYLRRAVMGRPRGEAIPTPTQGLAATANKLRHERVMYCIHAMMLLGEYVEALGPVLAEQGVEVLVELLRQHVAIAGQAAGEGTGAACGGLVASASATALAAAAAVGTPAFAPVLWSGHPLFLLLGLVCSLTAHRRFVELLAEHGGIHLLLKLPRSLHSYSGLSLALSSLSMLPTGFERVVSLPAPVPAQLVALGLALLGSGFDPARKNAVIFFASSLHFRAVLEEFDQQDGLRKLLNTMRTLVALMRTPMHATVTPSEARWERQVCYNACHALLQWARSHLLLHVYRAQRALALHSHSRQVPPVAPLHKPLDVSQEALAGVMLAVERDAALAQALARGAWPAVDNFVAQGGPTLALELVQMVPHERYFHEMSLSCLEVLCVITTLPHARRAVVGALMPSPQRSGMAVLLAAAGESPAGYVEPDPGMVAASLQVISNCVTPSPSLLHILPPSEGGSAPAPSSTVAAAASGRDSAAAASISGAEDRGASLTTPAPAARCTSDGLVSPEGGVTSSRVLPAGIASAVVRDPARASTSSALPDGPSTSSRGAGGDATPAPTSATPATPSDSLGERLQASYQYARACLRSSNGIRVLLSLLQPTRAGAGAVLGGAGGESATCVRAWACRALLGLARDPAIRQILAKLQIGRLLADLLRGEPTTGTAASAGGGTGGAMHRAPSAVAALVAAGGDGSGSAAGSAVSATVATGGGGWHAVLTRHATELLALTSAAGGGRPDKLAAAAATDAAAPALQRIERTAVAAATPLSYAPQELLLLMYEHLRAAGLTASAAMLAREASLARVPASLAAATTLGQTPLVALSHGPTVVAPPQQEVSALVEYVPQAVATSGPSAGAGGVTTAQRSQLANAGAAAGAAAAAAPASVSGTPAPASNKKTLCFSAQVLGSAAAVPKHSAGQGAPQPATMHVAGKAAGPEGSAAPPPSSAGPSQAPFQPRRSASSEGDIPGAAWGDLMRHQSKRRFHSHRSGAPASMTPGAVAPSTAGLSAEDTDDVPTAARVHSAKRLRRKTSSNHPLPASSTIAPLYEPPSASLSQPGGAGGATTALPTTSACPVPSSAAAAAAHISGRQEAQRQGARSDGDWLRAAPFADLLSTLPSIHALTPRQLQHSRSLDAAGGAAGGGSPLCNPLLSQLPSRRAAVGSSSVHHLPPRGRRSLDGSPSSKVVAPPGSMAAGGAPLEVPPHVEAAYRDVMAVTGPPVQSKLHAVVMNHLRQQHRAACLTAPAPTSTMPPVSLSRPYALPQATRALEAPPNVAPRLMRREVMDAGGGRGAARAWRAFTYSRFRHLRTFRDEANVITSCAFMCGSEMLVSGDVEGELKIQDTDNGDINSVAEAHEGAVSLVHVHDNQQDPLIISSGRSAVKLWRGMQLDSGPQHTWEGVQRGRFNNAGTQVAAVSGGGLGGARQALLYDVRTGMLNRTLQDTAASLVSPAGERKTSVPAASWSPNGELLLWGTSLWDLRVPASHQPLHRFDQFSDPGPGGAPLGCFHPAGLEVILNSEVWDLRCLRLLKSVPSLDRASVAFGPGGRIIYATLRRYNPDDITHLFAPRRLRHPLHSAFRTLDGTNYQDIATVDVGRAVLDLAVDPSDMLLGLAAVEIAENDRMVGSVRLFDVGRRRREADDSDLDTQEDDEESEDEDDDIEIDFDTDDDGDTPGGDRRVGGRRGALLGTPRQPRLGGTSPGGGLLPPGDAFPGASSGGDDDGSDADAGALGLDDLEDEDMHAQLLESWGLDADSDDGDDGEGGTDMLSDEMFGESDDDGEGGMDDDDDEDMDEDDEGAEGEDELNDAEEAEEALLMGQINELLAGRRRQRRQQLLAGMSGGGRGINGRGRPGANRGRGR